MYILENIAKGRTNVQALVTKHVDAFAKCKHECQMMDITVKISGENFPPQKQYLFWIRPDLTVLKPSNLCFKKESFVSVLQYAILQFVQPKSQMGYGVSLLIIGN